MAEYNDETLHRVWQYEKRIYQEIERVCGILNLNFFAAYGTALGALRHKGFIPWDDDMDICMPRSDYEILIEKGPALFNKRFELQEPRLTGGFVMPFAKLTDKKTTFVEETDQNRKYHSGIFVDIFPLEKMPRDAIKRTDVIKKNWNTARFMTLSEYGDPKLPPEFPSWKKGILKTVFACAHGLMLFTGQTKEKLYRKYLSTVETLDKISGDDFVYVNLLDFRAESISDDRDIYYEPSLIFPTKAVPFMDITVMVPVSCDEYLTRYYGDWREIPPEDERHNHVPSQLIFDDL